MFLKNFGKEEEMKRFFVNPKSLKGKKHEVQRAGRRVLVRFAGRETDWQVIE